MLGSQNDFGLRKGPRVRSYYVGLANEWIIHKGRTLPATLFFLALQGFSYFKKDFVVSKAFLPFYIIHIIKSQYPALCTMYLKFLITKNTANVIFVHISSQPS